MEEICDRILGQKNFVKSMDPNILGNIPSLADFSCPLSKKKCASQVKWDGSPTGAFLKMDVVI